MSPFRDETYQCPTCKVALRPHQRRLVCDTCQGMQMSIDDLRGAVEDLTSAKVELTFRDGAPASACPQCKAAMFATQVELRWDDQTATSEVVLARCTEHGPWLAGTQLAELFTAVERRMHRRLDDQGTMNRRWNP